MLGSFEYASLSALLKRTATITQASLGSQTLRSGTVALKKLRCVIGVVYIFASVKAITVKCLICENTARKELQSLELTSVAIGNPERHVCKASHRGSKQQMRSCSQSLLLLLARATHMVVLFFTHIPFVVNHTINPTLLKLQAN